jgi:hypothetical protein
MNTKTLNCDLIEAIKASLPAKANLPNALLDILKIGKEAIYRRLRCEVPFTLAEAATISKALGISLDRLSSVNVAQGALFNMYVPDYEDLFEAYYRTMKDFIANCVMIKDDPLAEWYTASNTIPHAFYMDHDYLLKFMLYKWLYQQNGFVRYYGELELPEKIRRMQAEYSKMTRSLASSYFIWDEMMFLALINDFRYFYDINLITEEEKKLLKEDFVSLIDTLEGLASEGAHENGRMVYFYISNINFEATYSYLSTNRFKVSFIRLYAINTIHTADSHVFEYQRDWIQSLKKYSTLISVSGERQRVQFFKKQRSFIDQW